MGWGWSTSSTVVRANRVEGNWVSFVMQRLVDGGLVYTLSAQPDSWIAGNWLYNQGHDYGGIYLDQGTMGYTLSQTVVASVAYWYLLQPTVAPPAQQNTVQHNFSDTSSAFCCGNLGCCTDLNTLADNVVFAPGDLPPEAQFRIHRAGLQAPYRPLRDQTVRIEAEAYNHGGEGIGYHDLSTGNAGAAYRSDDVDVYASDRCSGDHTVGWTETGEWLAWYVDAPVTGQYRVAALVGTQDASCRIDMAVDGQAQGGAALPNTGSWNSFVSAPLGTVSLNAGTHLLRMTFTGGFNFDAFDLELASRACTNDPSTKLQNVVGQFGGGPGTDILSVYTNPGCWAVSIDGQPEQSWLLGWAQGIRLHQVDFDGDGLDDVLLIDQSSLTWVLALSRGDSFSAVTPALTGWGSGSTDLIGDFDGDGLDDVAVVWLDPATTWRWHLARSLGYAFESHADAHQGTDPGAGACVRNVDADPADEIVMPAAGQCGQLDPSTWKFSVTSCSETCP